jgi:hypothetical protein
MLYNVFIGVILFCIYLPLIRITAMRSIYQVLTMFLTVLYIKYANFLWKIQYKIRKEIFTNQQMEKSTFITLLCGVSLLSRAYTVSIV